MSLNAAALRLMAEKGLSLDDVVEIAAAMETRSAAAERQQRYRDRKKADRNERDVTRDVTHPPKERNQTPHPSEPEGSSGSKRARKRSVSVEVPDWMPAEPWSAFVAMRERMHPKVQWSADAAKLVISKIQKLRGQGHCPSKLLERAVVSSWRTVFESEETKAAANGNSAPTTPEELDDRAAFFDRINKPDDAARFRREAARLRQSIGPPADPSVANLLSQATRALQSGAH